MNVLLLSPLPPPVGGIASWTVNILDYYKEYEDIEVVHQNTAIQYRSITKADFKSRLLSGSRDGLNTFTKFISLLNKHKPDVIHITSSGSMGLWKDMLIATLAKLHNIPVVIHFRFGRISQISKLNNWEWRVLKRVVALASATIVLDKESYQTLRLNGFGNIYNIPNPISKYVNSFLVESDNACDNETDVKVKVIFVGHITRKKGVFELVQACCLQGDVDELLLIGPYQEEVKRSLLDISVGANVKIQFAGILGKESVLAEMRRASMLILPSYSEGFPNVIIEAMAMRCPIVATDVGAISSMLDAESLNPAGIVIEPKSVQALSNAISIIANNPSISEAFKNNAFFKVKNEYTLEKVCSQYEKVWNSVHENREV